ncbi:MAG: type I secretion system permease/ATPase, partial [Pseudomonadota bacterium]
MGSDRQPQSAVSEHMTLAGPPSVSDKDTARTTRKTPSRKPQQTPASRAADEKSGTTAHLEPLKVWRKVLRRNLVFVGIFSLVINLLMLTIPIYLFQISDRVLSSRSIDTLVMLTGIALLFIGVLALLDIMRKRILGRVATQAGTILGGAVLAGLIDQAKLTDGGNTQILKNLHNVRAFISGPVMLLIFDAPMAPLYFLAVFLIHPQLGMIAVFSSVLLLIIAVLNQKLTSKTFGQAGAFSMQADEQAEALARNTQVVNAMGMMNEGLLQWGRQQAPALTHQLNALDRNYWISGISKFVRLTTQIGMLGWGGYLALVGEVTGGMMIAASIIAGRALQPVEGMIEGWRTLVSTREAYQKVIGVLSALEHEVPRLNLPKPDGRLSVEKLLYMRAGAKDPVLNGINFQLNAGESLAVIGPSGSGKSTLARVLVGCLKPTAGAVRLDETDLRNWDRRQFGEVTGYLPQEVELFPGTIKSNISRMRDDLPDTAIYEAAHVTGVHEMITHLPAGYETKLDGTGAPLSGGQKQRVALARAFLNTPSLVVLDEPNSNLDAQGEQALTQTICGAKAAGITTVVITQRPALLNAVDKV